METEKKELINEIELAMIYEKVCRGRNLFKTLGGLNPNLWDYALNRMQDLVSHRDEPYYVFIIVTEIKDNKNPALPISGLDASICPTFRALTLYILLYYRFGNDEYFTKHIIPEIRSTAIEACEKSKLISFVDMERLLKRLSDYCADMKVQPNHTKEELERLKAENEELKAKIAASGEPEDDSDVNADNDEKSNKKLAFPQEVQCKVLSLFLSQLNVNFTAHKKAISMFAKQLFGYESDKKCANYLNSITRLSANKAKDCKAVNEFFKMIGHEEIYLTTKEP